mmetsp:Transcript_13350/g.28986  ORF Transcript_13350/g.28986 Transcript_13350/m.28986 type:complete len:611 (-) Transcript_13350:36-1868(-)
MERKTKTVTSQQSIHKTMEECIFRTKFSSRRRRFTPLVLLYLALVLFHNERHVVEAFSQSSSSSSLPTSRRTNKAIEKQPKRTATRKGAVATATVTVPPIPTIALHPPPPPSHLIRIPEAIWRQAATDHRQRIKSLIEPGLVDADHALMKVVRKQYRIQMIANKNENEWKEQNDNNSNSKHSIIEDDKTWMTMMDPKHPVYNFLVEYYGLKGLKGPKRLARWSPSVGLFFFNEDDREDPNRNKEEEDTTTFTERVQTIQSLEEYYHASMSYQQSTIQCSGVDRGIFLEGATPDDFALTLHLKGAEWIDSSDQQSDDDSTSTANYSKGQQHQIYDGASGVLYRPVRYQHQDEATNHQLIHKKASSILWYKSILETTLKNEPVLHCYGLHEWAMQYWPEGANAPPSGKYQSHLPLRVSRFIINETVERKGLRCTHVDALRFFAPAAAPLNSHGSSLERQDQLRLENPACVHAHMDLLKIALKLTPFCDPSLLEDIIHISLKARSLDVGASPYDCSSYSSDTNPIPVIKVESPEARALYKELQTQLMADADSIRKRLLANYQAVLRLQLSESQLARAALNPNDEQFAKAEPGGLPWRQNLIERQDKQSIVTTK